MTNRKTRLPITARTGSTENRHTTAGELSAHEMAALWDLVIRTHHLALELRLSGASSPLVSARLATVISDFLTHWAKLTGEELDAIERRRNR